VVGEKIKVGEKRFAVVASGLPADLETPVSAFLKLRGIGATFLLESAESVDRLGRYSFIGFASGRSLFAYGDRTLYGDGRIEELEKELRGSTREPSVTSHSQEIWICALR